MPTPKWLQLFSLFFAKMVIASVISVLCPPYNWWKATKKTERTLYVFFMLSPENSSLIIVIFPRQYLAKI
jgi:hypothetical protein